MRKLCFVLMLALVSAPCFAKRLSKDDREFCAALGLYAFWIGTHKATGVPLSQAKSALLARFETIHPAMEQSVENLIATFYQDDIVLESVDQIAAIAAEVNDTCLDNRKKN